jgi:Undecaprenyl-phosphate glucose phosphotransferase
MLKQHNHLMLSLLVLADACAVACAWLASYWIRFQYLPVDPSKGIPSLSDKYLPLLPVVVAVHLLVFSRIRLYRPHRTNSILNETRDILKAFCVAVVAVILIDYALPASNKISRQFVATYAIVGSTLFALFRASVRLFLRLIRKRGLNRRAAAIVGSGRSAQRLLHALQNNPWTGFDVRYFVDDRQREFTGELRGLPIYGPLEDLRPILERQPVDAVFIALPAPLAHRTDDLLIALRTSLADIRIVPEINPYHVMHPTVSRLDGIPILSIRQTPLYGRNAILKRGFDLAVGALCLLLALAPMLLIAALIKLTSPGPVFYKQRRIGLDGAQFDMFKFRTMRADAEAAGPVWSQREDPRRTRIGAFLRRTSLDELPNLFNVLKGDMSLVGPRPERPEFIEQFKDEIPRYMLRHKMKAGMTGIAQIRGYRGDTSLRKRIQHDVHYINNWSLGLDVRIMFETLYGVWFSRHES